MNPTRPLGLWTSTALVVGNIVGMGIFLLPASIAPLGLNAVFGWLITVVGCIAQALVFARLAKQRPKAEGPYDYLREAFGEAPAFLAIWAYWVSMWVTTAGIAIGVTGYLDAVFPLLHRFHPGAVALALVWMLTALNLFGVKSGGVFQLATTVLKLTPLFVLILLGLWLFAARPESYSAPRTAVPLGISGIAAATSLSLFAMLGLESASLSAARVKDPERTIPRATAIGTLLTGAISLAVSTLPMFLLPTAELENSGAPFADVLNRYLAEGSGRWLALFIAISGIGAINGWILLTGEVTRVMSQRGEFPLRLSRLNRFASPRNALLFAAILASAMIGMSYSQSLVAGFTFLTNVTTLVTLPLYLGCTLALLRLWRKEPASRRPWMLPVCAIALAFVACVLFGSSATPLVMALGLALAGLPIFWLRRRV